MLVKSFGLNFFLKTPKNQNNIRYIYLRVTVDGLSRETSTKRTWDIQRWDSKAGRAIGTKEDARALNYFLETIVTKINQYKTDLLYAEKTITAQRIIDYILGKTNLKALLLEEFLAHNEEIKSLINIDYAIATYKRYVIARSHVQEFIKCKYNIEDIDFREINHEFIIDYENYLKTVRHCANNSTLKYIACLRKIFNRGLDKNIISTDPFKLFKRKRTKIVKKPLTKQELSILENHKFSTQRLSIVRDIFVFQCYTGLAYIDVYQLQKSDVKIGLDGEQWIMSQRQKTGSITNIPLLPKAIEILDKYNDNSLCLKRGTALPVSSNQKMNEYLKEIATLCNLDCALNTHKARRTFGSTITLNNDIPIHVVKEMLGHSSIKQTETYALTEQKTIGKE